MRNEPGELGFEVSCSRGERQQSGMRGVWVSNGDGEDVELDRWGGMGYVTCMCGTSRAL